MRKGGGSSKGSTFERDICKALSRWWTEGARDDVFWRTAGSGGRATNRAKSGQKTAGAYGDITYVDAIGEPLMRLCCFELKRGYGSWGALDLIDKIPLGRAKPPVITQFWLQAKRSAEDAGAKYPVVIFRRDGRLPGIIIPKAFLLELAPYAGPHRGKKLIAEIDSSQVVIMELAEFFDYCPSEHIRSLYASITKI